MFKRQLAYYVVAGSDCCACTGGASLLVWGATAIAGPWQLLGDIGTRIGARDDRHNPHRYVTNAQGSAVFTVGDQLLWLGNQWNTGRRRSADLLYWAQLRFETGVGANGSDPIPRVRKSEASADGTFALESLRTTKNHSRFGPFMGTSCCTDGTRLSPHVASRRWPCRLSKKRRGAHCTGRAQFPPWHAGQSASLGA